MQNAGIIRNRAKINAIITNARLTLDIQYEYGSLDNYLWRFVDGEPVGEFLEIHERDPSQYTTI